MDDNLQNREQPRILCVANWPSDVGYAWWLMESYWVVISKLYPDSFTTTVCFPKINTLSKEIANSQIECIEHDFAASSWDEVSKNISLIRRHNIKVLYLSDYSAARLEYFFYRMAGVKTIITHDHTPGLRTSPKGLKRFLKRIYANLPGIRADAAIGATPFVKDRLIDVACCSANRCYSVKNGIALKPNESALEHPLLSSLPKNKKIIVTASRANRYKGIDFALETVAQLFSEHKRQDVVYLFCGDGPDLERFKRKAKELGIEGICLFPGRVERVTDLFPHCHIAFQPSSGEVGYSLSILEYMAASLPVLVPDDPSVCGATTHRETGFVYQQQNKDDAVRGLLTYLNDEDERVRHGQNARNCVEKQYTLEQTHNELRRVIKRVIEQD